VGMKKIKYYHSNINIQDDFIASRMSMPDWYKNIPNSNGNKLIIPLQLTVKKCMPFLDSLLSGYTILTSQDIMIKQGEGFQNFNLTWAMDSKDLVTVAVRNDEHQIPVPDGFRKEELVWNIPFSFQLPLGYSMLVSHPLNRYELPFLTTSAIVDCDTEPMTSGKIPFFLKKDFQGIIPAGTPIVQFLPFKRESWEKKFDKNLKNRSEKVLFNTKRVAVGFYKKNIWKKKQYK
jgi:hypothetical protein